MPPPAAAIRRMRKPADTWPECRFAWKGPVAASLLLCDRCRSDASADHAPGCRPTRASVERPSRRSLAAKISRIGVPHARGGPGPPWAEVLASRRWHDQDEAEGAAGAE